MTNHFSQAAAPSRMGLLNKSFGSYPALLGQIFITLPKYWGDWGRVPGCGGGTSGATTYSCPSTPGTTLNSGGATEIVGGPGNVQNGPLDLLYCSANDTTSSQQISYLPYGCSQLGKLYCHCFCHESLSNTIQCYTRTLHYFSYYFFFLQF